MSVRVGDAVNVMVGERVGVALGDVVELCVAVGVSASTVNVAAGCVAVVARTVGVDVGGADGVRSKLVRSASKKPTPMRMGMAYLRSMSGNAAAVLTGFSPVCPNASSSFWKLTA